MSIEKPSKHTPTPWHVRSVYPGRSNTPIHQIAIGLDEDHICAIATINRGDRSRGERLANAEFIVRAVNNHEALYEACRKVVSWYEDSGTSDPVDMTTPWRICRDVLKLVKADLDWEVQR
jgi:hypothetical protein